MYRWEGASCLVWGVVRRSPTPESVRSSIGLGTVTSVRIDPILLDEEISRPKFHIGIRTIAGAIYGAKRPGTLVAIFLAALVVPSVQVRIGDCFLQLVGDNAGHAVGTGIAIRASGLGFA